MGTQENEIPFVVRGTSASDVVLKTSDATWQAYNSYGGADFYGAPGSVTPSGRARAVKISYNRPYLTRDRAEGRDYLYSNEYPTLRFLERNGVDVSYTTDVDVSTGATDLLRHKTFLSVGHDEYWSGPERANVEAARDAGVNLMFLSGNEVYWHTRLEPSIDGTATPNRTIVCYKDSWESSKIDPGEGTPTWRDPAQPAPAGSQPENALTGTMYMSNFTDLPITVSAAQGKSRLWRGTSLASLPAGGSQALAPHTVGYESDEDVDNGSRPAGLMRLSETTGPTDQLVQNPGGTEVAPGTTTHSVTLYRAPSGALVFGAGTINWGWGLDQYHDGDNSNPADSRMQQATLNMLADMGSLPTTLMTGLVMPSASSDHTAPTVSVSAPAPGASLANGASVTVTGTAADTGGGVVTTVEVSLDGGQSWHRAIGTTSWSYTGIIGGRGPEAIKVRASDDSANLGSATSVAVTVSCPCSLFGERVPDVTATSDGSSVELGVKFVPQSDGYVTGIRFYKGAGNVGTHTGTLWSSTGTPLASGTFVGESGSGWQTLLLGSAVPVTGGTTYVASYTAPQGHYAASAGFFGSADWAAPPLLARGASSGVANGIYGDAGRFPDKSYGATNYWVDALFTLDDTTPPTVAQTSPLNGASSVTPAARPSATFAGTVDPATVVMSLVDAQGTVVPGSASFDAATRTVRYTPTAPLSYGATYRAAVEADSAAGVPMAAPHSWTFTVALTDPEPGICPCSIWPDSATPEVASANDTGSVELGVKFRADVDGTVDAVRFYKGSLNVGTHTGSLWTAAGVQLASVTFTGETSSGWQTAYFSSPVDIAADTTYIVSYRAPSGGYAVTSGGLGSAVDSGPLHTLAAGATYTYGSGAPLTSSSTNYWVDLVFTATDAAPSVAATAPSSGATNVPTTDPVSATLNGYVRDGTARLSVEDPSGNAVTGAVSYVSASRTISFQPGSALEPNATYTATVSGATSLSGGVMQPHAWTFTTAGVGACPCTLFSSAAVPSTVDSGDPGSVELGVAFTPTADGQITGVRFYKSALNTGTHTGTLWSSTGQVLATGSFTGESASGWQGLQFAQPVPVTSGTTYVASYLAPNGHYAASSGFFAQAYTNGPLTAVTPNGRYAYGSGGTFPTGTYGATNYWVDPVFITGTPPDTTPPSVTATTPTTGATSLPVDAAPAVTFSEDVVPASVTVTLTGAGVGSVTGSVAYDSGSRTATFTPASALQRGVTYTASASASDPAGNALTPAHAWSFTTAQPDPAPGVCPCGLWTDGTQPTRVSDTDTLSVELGTAFSADADGVVTGVRFYKSEPNTGPHPVSLWTAGGSLLATATPATESAAGWQTVSFAAPVPVTAGTTYVVSYLAPNGRYSSVAQGLSAALDVAPLHTAPNAGRYAYGAGGFPVNSSSASYLVDPVFDTSGGSGGGTPADTTAPAITGVAATVSGTTATITWTTDEASTSSVSYGTSAGSLGSTATGDTGTSHTVAIAGLSEGTTYHFRVTSADAAGNSSTSPTAADAPATFATADTTPPTITGVAATGAGTTATVSWTTDESSTSSVAYGTSAGSLGSTVTGFGGTSHSVTLTGLAPNTRYYYRVTSADAAGNSSTSPATGSAAAQYVPDVTPLTLTTVSDFSAGSGGYVADDAGGEVVVAPTAGFEFAGSTLPTGLTATTLATGGTSTVAGGTLSLDGRQVAYTSTGTTMSLVLKGTVTKNQTFGLAQSTGVTGVRAAFVVGPTGALSIVSTTGGSVTTASVPGTWTGAPHVFEVRRVSNSTVAFLVDDSTVATRSYPTKTALRPMVADSARDSSALSVDWLRIGRYGGSSTWTSAVVDAGAVVSWTTLSRDVLAPSGTTVSIQVRSGSTATPGGGWTGWSTVSTSTGSIARSARYLQTRIVSTASSDRFTTPQTRSVTLAFDVP